MVLRRRQGIGFDAMTLTGLMWQKMKGWNRINGRMERVDDAVRFA